MSVNHGKGLKRRTIPLNEDARSILLELGYYKQKGSNQLLFIGQRGVMTPRGIESTYSKIR
ncbi:hypothetical protein [Pleurocapsa sp. FMAR1]|uniref:hypothetical protein n=1 Tax=Pleurocapsa sp. FMAR1 TaxID=3040204 RepID=UPI0029C79FED|nr:hypothetical protein [Pleurocapsa sp. FMAR1]